MDKPPKIIFVYNAKSGFMHSMAGLFRKKASPNTYPCKLCSLTYSGAFMKKIWKQYIASLKIETVFLHKDEFAKAYPGYEAALPVILLVDNHKLTKLISDKDFRSINDLAELISLINKRLSNAKR